MIIFNINYKSYLHFENVGVEIHDKPIVLITSNKGTDQTCGWLFVIACLKQTVFLAHQMKVSAKREKLYLTYPLPTHGKDKSNFRTLIADLIFKDFSKKPSISKYCTNPCPDVIKLFSCSTQLSTKFQLLIKTKILTNEAVSSFKSLRCCNY